MKSALVLSSVIHEVYSYGSANDIDSFWERVFTTGFDYIIIRDLIPSVSINRMSDMNDVVSVMRESNGELVRFEQVWGSIEQNKNLIHYLMKYRYKENYSREVLENYFPLYREELLRKITKDYKVTHHDHYVLPFVKRQVKNDFDIDIVDNTHIKLILEIKMSLLDCFVEIGSDSSRLFKVATLKKFADVLYFKSVLRYAYDSSFVYFIKDVTAPSYDTQGYGNEHIPFDFLDRLASRQVTGNKARDELDEYFRSLDAEYATLLALIINKDLKCGINVSTINEAFPNLIGETPYMGAIGFSEKKARAMFADGTMCYADIKMDGRYANVIVYPNGTYEMESRQGKRSYIKNRYLEANVRDIADKIRISDPNGIVLNGEMTIPGMPRYESNGLISSLVKIVEKEGDGKDVTKEKAKFEKKHGMTCDRVSDMIMITVWDYLPYDLYRDKQIFNRSRDLRLGEVRSLLRFDEESVTKIGVIETTLVKTYEEAIAVFKNAIARGDEGVILKSSTGVWQSGKPSHQMKMKLEFVCELEVIGFNRGNVGTEWENSLGSFQCKSSDGLLLTDPAGIEGDVRDLVWNAQDEWMGKIVSVKCNGLSQDVDGNYSLLHPVYRGERTDKSVADSLDDIKKIQAMIVGLE